MLTAVVIDRMINNYGELSYKDKENLINNYTNMSKAQQKALRNASRNEMLKTAEKLKETGDQESAEDLIKIVKKIDQAFNLPTNDFIEFIRHDKKFCRLHPEIEKMEQEDITTLYEQYLVKKQCDINELQNIVLGFSKQDKKDTAEMILLFEKYKELVEINRDNEEVKKISDFLERLRKGSIFGIEEIEEKVNLIITRFNNEKSEILEQKENLNKCSRDQSKSKNSVEDHNRVTQQQSEVQEYFNSETTQEKKADILGVNKATFQELSEEFEDSGLTTDFVKKEESEKQNFPAKVSKKIEQIPIALAKYGFEADEIKQALTEYGNYFKNQGEDFTQALSEMTAEDFLEMPEMLKEEFQELNLDKRVTEILGIMAEETFGNNLQAILLDPEMKLQFFSRVEKSTNIDFVKVESEQTALPIKDESFSDFFSRFQEDIEVGEDSKVNSNNEAASSDTSNQGNTSSVITMFNIESVKMASRVATMSQIQNNIQLVSVLREGRDEAQEMEMQDEEQTV